MNADAQFGSALFSHSIIHLRQKLIQPSVLNLSERPLSQIDTQRLKIIRKKSQFSPVIDSRVSQKVFLHRIQSRQKKQQNTKQVEKFGNGLISRQRYILPPVYNIRKILKNNSAIQSKNEELLNSYVNKEEGRFITPMKKNTNKSYNSVDHVQRELVSYLKKNKTRNKNLIYYRPEQVRKQPLQPDDEILKQHKSAKNIKYQLKLRVADALRKRTKTQLQTKITENYDFFKLETCYNQSYVTFDSISNSQSSAQSRLIVNQKILHLPRQEQLKEILAKYQPLNEQISIKSLLKSNFCSVQFSKRYVYVGQMIGKQRSGYGILFTLDACFQGVWKTNHKIRGVEITKQGVYKGNFKNDCRDGKGEFQWTNGELYVGDWLKGHQHGQGLWINTRGETYNGQWRSGKAEGIGSLIIKNTQHFKSGRKYKGAFHNNKQHGFGRQSFANGDSYQGIYRQDRPCGKGIYVWANGSIYQGQFEIGMRMGMGVLKTSFNLTYKGQFIDDFPDGQCEIILPNGDTYYGMVKDGMKNGKGTLRLRKSKQIFNGYWKNDYFIGQQDQTDLY